MRRPFAQVDVFTAVPYRGNPLAVVADAEGLTTDEMRRFASWTNLSETTFLLEPTSDWRPVRRDAGRERPTLRTVLDQAALGNGLRESARARKRNRSKPAPLHRRDPLGPPRSGRARRCLRLRG